MRAMRHCLAVLLVLLLAAPAAGEEAGLSSGIRLVGLGDGQVMLTPDVLAQLPRVEREVTFETSAGPSTGRYEGVLLWDVLTANGAFAGMTHGEGLTMTFLIRARDGYEIAFSVGEIHPDFGDMALMLAHRLGGQPIDSGYRVIAPGDRRGARNVREVVEIELR